MHIQPRLWHRAMRNARLLALLIALTPSVLYLSSCQPLRMSCASKRFERGNGLAWGIYKGAEPKLLVLTDPSEIAAASRLISEPSIVVNTDSGETWEASEWSLQGMDWDAFFVVIAFQGFNKDGVTITRIVQKEQHISVFAQYRKLGATETRPAIQTSPLHVVKAEKPRALRARSSSSVWK